MQQDADNHENAKLIAKLKDEAQDMINSIFRKDKADAVEANEADNEEDF